MDHPGDIGETLAWTRGQRLFGPLCGGTAEELRHRLALDSGRSPDLLIKFGIKPKASHIRTVSHPCLYVIQLEMADLRSDGRLYPALAPCWTGPETPRSGRRGRISPDAPCAQIAADPHSLIDHH